MMSVLTTVFWFSLALVVYVYLGYPTLIFLCARRKPKPELRPEPAPSEFSFITIIIPAYNEEGWIRRKIENTLKLNYPRKRRQILIASDGSTDRTVEIAGEFPAQGVEVVPFPQRLGKPEMLNRLVPQLAGEVVVVTDANALLEPDAVRRLVRHFSDPRVGCATGRRLCVLQSGSAASLGEGLYWRYESWIKDSESRMHSCLGAHGQLYAVRRSVFPHVENVGDDFYIPMRVIATTHLRVVYDPEAVAYIPAAASLAIERERKTRAHVSFLLTLPLLKELLLPWRSPVWWQYLSHHVLRMFVPIAMVTCFLSSALLAKNAHFYLFLSLAQIVFYTLAGIGFLLAQFGLRPKIFYAPFYFVFANLAIAQSWMRWPVRKYNSAWERTERFPISSRED